MKRKIKLTACLMALIATVAFGFTGCMYIDGNDGQWHSWGPNCNDPNFTGMDCNEYGWWYFQNGVIDWNYTGMACNDYGWWYFKNGQIDWGYTGMACNQYGWWYYQNGRLDWGYNGFGFNEYGGWLYQNGTIAWNYTGDYGNYYIKGGHLDHEHSYITKNAKNATCSQNGYTGDTVCKHCGKVAKRGSSTAKLNHSYETRNAKEATCTQNGYTGDKVCKNCGYTIKGNSTAKLEHKGTLKNNKLALTSMDGYTGDTVCKDCGTVLSKGEVIPRRDPVSGKSYTYTYKTKFDSAPITNKVIGKVVIDLPPLYAGMTRDDWHYLTTKQYWDEYNEIYDWCYEFNEDYRIGVSGSTYTSYEDAVYANTIYGKDIKSLEQIAAANGRHWSDIVYEEGKDYYIKVAISVNDKWRGTFGGFGSKTTNFINRGYGDIVYSQRNELTDEGEYGLYRPIDLNDYNDWCDWLCLSPRPPVIENTTNNLTLIVRMKALPNPNV